MKCLCVLLLLLLLLQKTSSANNVKKKTKVECCVNELRICIIRMNCNFLHFFFNIYSRRAEFYLLGSWLIFAFSGWFTVVCEKQFVSDYKRSVIRLIDLLIHVICHSLQSLKYSTHNWNLWIIFIEYHQCIFLVMIWNWNFTHSQVYCKILGIRMHQNQ